MTAGFRSHLPRRARAQPLPAVRCVIGEVAQAHDGSLGMAHAFIDAIAAAGAVQLGPGTGDELGEQPGGLLGRVRERVPAHVGNEVLSVRRRSTDLLLEGCAELLVTEQQPRRERSMRSTGRFLRHCVERERPPVTPCRCRLAAAGV